jgi:predicted dienelactone hydrolase
VTRALLALALLAAVACRGRVPDEERPNGVTQTAAGPQRDPVGVTTRDFDDPARGRPLATTIWYPAAPGSVEEVIWWDGIFPGHGAWQAPLRAAPSRLPVVLLSHGSGGDGSNLAWLAEGLAEHGYVVVAVDHPGDRFGDTSQVGRFAAWRRPRDVTVVLTRLLTDETFGPRIDAHRIGAAGHSSGGFTVLELAGVRFRPATMLAYCKGPHAGTDCTLIAGVDLASIPDRDDAQRSYRDRRIRAVLALAPVLGPGVTAPSLRAIDVPVGIVASPTDELVPYARNAERYARLIPHARQLAIPDAGHFVFMPVCTEAGKVLIPMVCVDRAPEVDRSAVHAQALEWATPFFDKALAPSSTQASRRRSMARAF